MKAAIFDEETDGRQKYDVVEIPADIKPTSATSTAQQMIEAVRRRRRRA